MWGLSIALVLPALGAPVELAYGSGLRVVLDADPAASRVASAMYIDAGGLDDPAGREGIAHLVEHLWFDSREPEGPAAWDVLNGLGCEVSAETWPEFTRFLESCPPGAADALLPLELRRVYRPLQGVDAADLALAAQVVAIEDVERADNWAERLIPALYPVDHPLSERLARPSRVPGLDRAAVEAFAEVEYRPERAVLALAGAFDAATVRAALDRLLGPPLPNPPPRVPRRAAPPHRRALRVAPRTLPGPADTPLATVAWSLPYAEIDGFTREMLRRAAARALWGHYRYDARVVDMGCDQDAHSFAAPLVCTFEAATNEDAVAIAGELRGVVEHLWDGGNARFLEEMLASASAQARVARAVFPRQLGTDGYAAELAQAVLGGGSADILGAGAPRLRPADLLALAQEHLAADRALVVAWTPTRETRAPLRVADLPRPAHPPAPAAPLRAPPAPREARRTLPSGLVVLALSDPGLPVVEAVLRVQTGRPSPGDGAAAVLRQRTFTDDDRLRDVLPFDASDARGLRHGVLGAAADPEKVLAGLLARVSPRRLDLDPREPWLDRLARAKERDLARPAWWGGWLPEVALDATGTLAKWATGAQLVAMRPFVQPDERLDLARRLAEWYRPDNAALVVVGPQDPAALLTAAEAVFGGWKGQPAPAAKAEAKGAVQTTGADAKTAVQAGVPLPALVLVDDPEASLAIVTWRCPVAAEPAERALLGHVVSYRMFDILRVERAWAYTPYAWSEAAEDGGGQLVAEASVPPDRAPAALARIEAEIADLAAGRVDPALLARAQAERALANAAPLPGHLTDRAFGPDGLRADLSAPLAAAGQVTPATLATALGSCLSGERVAVTGPGEPLRAAFTAAGREAPLWTPAHARAAVEGR